MERLERLNGRHVRRQRRSGLEEVPEAFAAFGEPAVEGVSPGQQEQQDQDAPRHVILDLEETEREVLLRLEVVNRLRRGVDLERGDLQIDRVAAAQRVEDILVGVEHLRRAEVVLAFVEGRQPVTLAQFQVASVAFERIHRAALHQFDLAVAGVEFGEFHHLHQVFFHVDDVVEAVADHDAVGFDTRRDGGRVLRPGCEGREEKRYCKESFHRCLNSFISSAT